MFIGGRICYLEESKLFGVRWRRLGRTRQGFYHNMRMSFDSPLCVELLRRSEIILLSVHKISGRQVFDGHTDCERRVGSNSTAILGVGKLRRGHLVCCWNGTDGGRVARASCDLLSVGDGQVGDGQTEVDEIISRCQGSDLAFEYILFYVFLCRCQITYRLLGHPVRYLQIQSR